MTFREHRYYAKKFKDINTDLNIIFHVLLVILCLILLIPSCVRADEPISQAVPPPANPVIFSHPRILPSHVDTFRALLSTVKGTQQVLVIGPDLGHVVAVLAHTGLGLYWLTGTQGHDKAFDKPMSAVILSDELRQTNALAWSAAHSLQVGGLMFVPESMVMMPVYLHIYGMERTGLKLKQFLTGGYFTVYQKHGAANGKHKRRMEEAA